MSTGFSNVGYKTYIDGKLVYMSHRSSTNLHVNPFLIVQTKVLFNVMTCWCQMSSKDVQKTLTPLKDSYLEY